MLGKYEPNFQDYVQKIEPQAKNVFRKKKTCTDTHKIFVYFFKVIN